MEQNTERLWGTNTDYKQYFDGWMDQLNQEQWLALLERMPEKDLTNKVVLDFGCNRGASLRILYAQRPFAHGYGVDLDTEAIRVAQSRQGDLPLTYQAKDNIQHLAGTIDLAFSHEVLYLLKDLAQHAQEVFNALKAHGVYYVALGAHADNPIWQRLKAGFAKDIGVEPQDYTLYQIVDVFERQGFTAEARKFKFDGFLPLAFFAEDRGHFSMLETLDYYSEYKVLFRFSK